MVQNGSAVDGGPSQPWNVQFRRRGSRSCDLGTIRHRLVQQDVKCLYCRWQASSRALKSRRREKRKSRVTKVPTEASRTKVITRRWVCTWRWPAGRGGESLNGNGLAGGQQRRIERVEGKRVWADRLEHCTIAKGVSALLLDGAGSWWSWWQGGHGMMVVTPLPPPPGETACKCV